jgi:mitosis inhibitor protein kinase SWE1
MQRSIADFKSSMSSNAAFPPATPTTSREQAIYFANGQGGAVPIIGLTANDVDTSLTARFGSVTLHGVGEFSLVYRVSRSLNGAKDCSPGSQMTVGGVWAVKKTRRPYVGVRDRERKLREVTILKALCGHEHVIAFADNWESKGHLYIQTEFCENGNLKDFLSQAGFKGRLDDFRIWKILLELTQVSKCR